MAVKRKEKYKLPTIKMELENLWKSGDDEYPASRSHQLDCIPVLPVSE